MKEVAWDEVKKSFESFCMMVGVESLTTMFEVDAKEICGHRHGRGAGKRGHRWGTTQGTARFQGGTIDVDRPRVRDRKGREVPLPRWEPARDAGFLKQWPMNLTLMNVAMRKFGRASAGREGSGHRWIRAFEIGGLPSVCRHDPAETHRLDVFRPIEA